MPLTVEQFCQRVTTSGVMPESDLRDWIAAVPVENRPDDGEALARELVKQKKLTKFQAEQIYAGKGESLTLGNYVVLDKLGQGGMGMVLKAWHRRMERTVALKVIAPRVVKDAVALKRFQREVVAAAKLTHPNIVAAYDADEAKGTHFLVMEYVDGTDLSAFVKKNGPMPVEMAVNCIVQAARGLQFAHEQGVIHRDIKPHNLLMKVVSGPSSVGTDSNGPRTTDYGLTVKILDMGLARLEGNVGGSAEHADLTNSGAMMGTVDYMAPEQAMDSKHADARSDIYSLGCTFFYLLTGHATFVADTVMKRLTAHQNAPPPSLTEEAVRAEINSSSSQLAALNAVFQRMVSKRPSDRFQTMGEVITALERCRAALDASSDSATNSDVALQSFLRDITGENSTATRTTATAPVRTAVLPNDDATIVEQEFARDTDATLHETIAREANAPNLPSKKSSRGVLIAGVLVAALLLAVGFFVMRGPSGTLHLEVGDELTHVTVGETGHVVKGTSEQDLRLPVGEYVLHIEREKLAFDTDAFELTKSGTVSVKVERVGRAVRAMMGKTLLGRQEESTPSAPPATADFALEFDGVDDYVDLPSLSCDTAKPITLEGWVKPFSADAHSHLMVLHGKTTVAIQQSDSSWHGLRLGGSIVQMIGEPIVTPLSVRPTHLALVWDGSQQDLFVDGRRTPQRTTGGANLCGDSGALLGCVRLTDSDPQLMYFFRGRIDEVRVSKTARYQKDFTPKERLESDADTLALYHFDEGRGSELKDSSGNGHHGKIVGAKWVAAPATSSASSGSSQPAPDRSTAAMSRPDRVAAEWVLSVQGSVSIREPGGPPRLISQSGQLPAGEFEVAYINIQSAVNKDRVTDDSLRNLRSLKALKMLNLNDCRNISAAGLRNLVDSPLLESIDLNFSKVDDQAVEELVKLRSLKTVNVGESQITDAGIERLCRELPVLENLSLSARSTDKSLKALAEARNLKSLNVLKSKHLTDDGIGWLLNAPQITTLNIVTATDEMLRKVETLTQTTALYVNLCLATPTGIQSLAKLPRLEALGLSDSPMIGDDHLEKLSEMRTVTELHLAKTGVTDHGTKLLVGLTNLRVLSLKETAITDQAVTDLSRMTNLRRLNITETKLTSEGVDTLRKALSNCRITSDHGTFGPLLPLNDVPPPANAPFDARQARAYQEAWAKHLGTEVETANSLGIKLTLIPPGEFLMGSTPEQVAVGKKLGEQDKSLKPDDLYWSYLPSEMPQRQVTLTRPLWMGTTEVTVGQFRKFVEATKYVTYAERYGFGDSSETLASATEKQNVKESQKGLNWKSSGETAGDNFPVRQIAWDDAVAFCAWLSEQEGLTPWYRNDDRRLGWVIASQANGYRLPTEAEWEYACRAGTTTQFWHGDEVTQLAQHELYADSPAYALRPVGSKRPNPFGLFDMTGSVREWCQDFFDAKLYEQGPAIDPLGPTTGRTRAIRGGSWSGKSSHLRTAYRYGTVVSNRSDVGGFRIVRVTNATGRASE